MHHTSLMALRRRCRYCYPMNYSDSPLLHVDTYPFVDLGRTFHEISADASANDEADLRRAFHVGDKVGWPDLIKEYRTIILSEAGSGKTAEIRNAARTIRAQGKPAFFLRLEHIPDDFEDAFEVGTFEDFQAWLASSEEGWLLLDSVDEARLRNPGDFERAIRKLGRRMKAALDRTHIIITGRTTAWRPKTDLSNCIAQLPFAPAVTAERDQEIDDDNTDGGLLTDTKPEGRAPSIFRIVALDDLTSKQTALFAEACGIVSSKLFLEAVERADAWSFTARPQDLEELAGFWIDNGRIGSRLEIMRNSID